MGVAVDQCGSDPASLAIDRLIYLGEVGGQGGFRADKDDTSVSNGNRSVFDDSQTGQ